MTKNRTLNLVVLLAALFAAALITGCNVLTPQMSYQGRLTDQNGTPLQGTVDLTVAYYHVETGGTAFFSQNLPGVSLAEGLFDAVLGVSAPGSGLSPAELSEPIWIEITVDDGTYSETLSPRQRLYGAPYAFSLIPSAYISGTMDTLIWGAGGSEAMLSIYNTHDGDASNPALPSLKVYGQAGLELAGGPNVDSALDPTYSGLLTGDTSHMHNDLLLKSNDEVAIVIDADGNNSAANFGIYHDDTDSANRLCTIDEAGNLRCAGTISGNAFRSVTELDGQQREIYPLSNTEMRVEDVGSAALADGFARVELEPLFAATIAADADYQVFLTPLGDCNGLYVAAKDATGFEVRELGGGTASVAFDYRIIAKRSGYEETRMELNVVETGAD